MFKKIIMFLLSLILCIQLSPVLSQSLHSSEQATDIKTLQLHSQEAYEQGNLFQSYQDLQTLIPLLIKQGNQEQQNLAIAWTNLGHLQFSLGKPEWAIKSWQASAKIYQSLNQNNAIISLQFYQAKALQNLGLYPRACQTLTQALSIDHRFCLDRKITQDKNKQLLAEEIYKNIKVDSQLSLDGFRILSELLAKVGRLEEAMSLLNQLDLLSPNATTALALGNTFRSMGNLARDRQAEVKYKYVPWKCDLTEISKEVKNNYNKALDQYQQVINNASQTIQTKARLNQFSLLMKFDSQENNKKAEKLSKIIAIDLPKLPTSYTKVYAQINYAKNLACLQQQEDLFAEQEIINLLEKSIEEAKRLESISDFENAQSVKKKPKVLESYAVGNLGGFYEYLSLEYSQNSEEYRRKSLQLTQEALYLAQPSEAPQLAYQWQWQLGRLLEADGELEQAIKMYELAAKTLELVRRDILTINSDVQFSFRDNIEPLYRELVNLLLSSYQSNPDSEVLQKVLDYTEFLQLAELENFLGCSLSSDLKSKPSTDLKAAMIYPIVLQDRLAILLKMPSQKLEFFETVIPRQKIDTTLKELRDQLTQIGGGTEPEIIEKSHDLYRWLFQPLESTLKNHPEIETLVFILDGSLRNIPMAILYDGEQYLVEKKYAIAIVPGLTLFNPQLTSSPLKVFTGGVGLPQKFSETLRFSEIKQLESEIKKISQFVETGEPLLNQKFTKANIRQQLESVDFSAIHWKTHGSFSSDPQNTFIVAYNELITPNDLSQLIQTGSKNKTKPLELLVLSACETAQGDNRAILGLSGIAVRSGAASTLSTLWRANDAATTELMTQFYQELSKPEITKANALKKAQLSLLKKYKDPYIWATYVLVGSWL